MDWFYRQKGPGLNQGTTDQTITSPSPLLPIIGILCLLFLASYKNSTKDNTVLDLKLFLLFLPVVFIVAVQFVSKWEKFVVPYGRTKRESWNLPWGMLLLVLLLLVIVSHQS